MRVRAVRSVDSPGNNKNSSGSHSSSLSLSFFPPICEAERLSGITTGDGDGCAPAGPVPIVSPGTKVLFVQPCVGMGAVSAPLPPEQRRSRPGPDCF